MTATIEKLALSLIALAFLAASRPIEGDDLVKTLPPERGGQDLIGTVWPKLSFDAWLATPERKPLQTEGGITLFRWWTDACPYCEKSLPALEKLRGEFASTRVGEPGLRIVAVYHPKPARAITEADHKFILDAASERGYHGPIAIDADWSELERVWLDTGSRDATSASFVVDEKGVIRFVHPGPQFFASDEPAHARDNSDFQMLREAIRMLLNSRKDNPADAVP